MARAAADRRVRHRCSGRCQQRAALCGSCISSGERPTYIARRVSWSADGKAIFAAVGEGDADVVLLRGLGTNFE